MSEKMYTQKEAAHLLGVSTRTIQRWGKIGIIKRHVTRTPGLRGFVRLRYSESDITALLSYTRQVATGTRNSLAN